MLCLYSSCEKFSNCSKNARSYWTECAAEFQSYYSIMNKQEVVEGKNTTSMLENRSPTCLAQCWAVTCCNVGWWAFFYWIADEHTSLDSGSFKVFLCNYTTTAYLYFIAQFPCSIADVVKLNGVSALCMVIDYYAMLQLILPIKLIKCHTWIMLPWWTDEGHYFYYGV